MLRSSEVTMNALKAIPQPLALRTLAAALKLAVMTAAVCQESEQAYCLIPPSSLIALMK